MRVEAEDGRRGVGAGVGELVDVERIDGDLIVVRLSRRRAGAAVADLAVVVARLKRARRQASSEAGLLGQSGRIRRKIGDPLVHRIVETNHMRAGFIFPDGNSQAPYAQAIKARMI